MIKLVKAKQSYSDGVFTYIKEGSVYKVEIKSNNKYLISTEFTSGKQPTKIFARRWFRKELFIDVTETYFKEFEELF